MRAERVRVNLNALSSLDPHHEYLLPFLEGCQRLAPGACLQTRQKTAETQIEVHAVEKDRYINILQILDGCCGAINSRG